MLETIEVLPVETWLDEYSNFAYDAVRAAERMYPGATAFACSGIMGCVHASNMPVLVELPDGDIRLITYRADS